MHRWLAGLLFLLAGVTCAQAHELLDRLDACIEHLDQNLDVGYERIAARCPEVTAALGHEPWSPWLPADWNQPGNQLSAEGLKELRTLLARTLKPSAPVHAPQAANAAAAVARISQAEDSRAGWWQRVKAWLRALTTGRDRDSDALGGWLGALDFSGRATKVVAGLALALVVAIALAILVNELRIAGVLESRAGTARGRPRPLGANEAGRALTEVERHDARQQPALLLELIADRLTAQGRLPPARALTTRELLHGARLADESERTSLSELAEACEQLRYSTREIAATRLASAIAAGRKVLARLEMVAPGRDLATPGA